MSIGKLQVTFDPVKPVTRYTRSFDAPKRAVWDALTQADKVRQWYGPRSMTMKVCEIDLRVGGTWRYVQSTPDGSEFGFSGVYKEITPHDRLVSSEWFEAMPEHDYLVTLVLDEQAGKTTINGTLVYKSMEARDGHANSGMEPGMAETFDRLNELVEDASDREIVNTRIIKAPRALVWQAFTDPGHLIAWWGPDGFSNRFKEVAIKPGGVWRFDMIGPDGVVYPNKIVFHTLTEPSRIAFVHSGDDGAVDDPHKFDSEILLEEHGSDTKVTLRARLATREERDAAMKFGANAGAQQTLARMAEHVEGKEPELLITRTFEASRALVWKAFTDPQHLMKWWGPKGVAMQVAKMDLRPGGCFHYSYAGPDGNPQWGLFEYRDVSPTERLVFTNAFSNEAGEVLRAPFNADWPLKMINVWSFEEHDGKTTLTGRGRVDNGTDAERALFGAMKNMIQEGFKRTMDQLDQHLAQAKAAA